MNAPEISVVVEWENVLLAGEARSLVMLQRLGAQARAVGRPLEVVVVCDAGSAGTAPLAGSISSILGPGGADGIPWKIVDVPGAHYYELKNHGVREARGAIVVFLDSDVIPEDGWLAALVRAFDDPRVQVVAGHTYLDARGLYGGAMALGWFFPPRSETATRHDRGTHFFANNVAFRADLLRTHPFPAAPDGSTRGACADLAVQLRREGVRIWVDTAAQVGHPPPNGGRHFFTRAIAEGRDVVLEWIRAGKARAALPPRILERHVKRALRAWRSIAVHRQSVGLSAVLVIPACAIMATYYTVACGGAMATWVAPSRMARGFRI